MKPAVSDRRHTCFSGICLVLLATQNGKAEAPWMEPWAAYPQHHSSTPCLPFTLCKEPHTEEDLTNCWNGRGEERTHPSFWPLDFNSLLVLLRLVPHLYFGSPASLPSSHPAKCPHEPLTFCLFTCWELLGSSAQQCPPASGASFLTASRASFANSVTCP